MFSRPARIFMLEPDEDDRLITQSIFVDKLYPVEIRFFTKPEELFGMLENLDSNQSPNLFLINGDLRPEGTAIDVVRKLKSGTRMMTIPVVVISNGMVKEEVNRYYQAGANSFIQKPFTNHSSIEKIDTFIKYWFEVAELPQEAVINWMMEKS